MPGPSAPQHSAPGRPARWSVTRWLGVAAIGGLVLAVVEVLGFILVARAIGVAWMLVLALATSLLGGWLLRREGVRGWRRFRTALAERRPPGREATDGLLGLIGALLLLVPGFLSDAVGLLLLTPPVRAVARAGALRAAEARISPSVAGNLFGPRRVRVRRGQPSSSTSPERSGPRTVAPRPATPPPSAPREPGPARPAVPGDVVEGEIID